MLDLQEISDRLELTDLMVRYSHAVDTRSWDEFDDIFTPDAVIDYTAFGGPRGTLEETKQYLASTLSQFPSFQHLLANPELRIDGDSATGRTMCFNPMGVARPEGEAGEPRMFFCGLWYLDTFRRTEQGWRIATRSEEKSWTHNMGRAFGGASD
ncbi:MAG: nuclear transport factor 2 family protein [Microthrixaceae bacterium]